MIPLRDRNPSRTTPFVNYLLIAANLLCFLYELGLGPEQLDRFVRTAAFIPARYVGDGLSAFDLVHGAQSALLSMFLHAGWAHFLGNMLFLWIFGDNVEDRLGHGRYLLFYLGCGYAATLAHAFAGPTSQLPAVGASGAISGVLGAYLFLYPRARILSVIPIFFFLHFLEVPALVFLPLWFLMQFISGLASLGAPTAAEAGGVAWFAHIGGFVAGPLLLLLLGGFSARRRRPAAASPPIDW
jgi:membrane associated rhomboid family serine protease